MRQDLLTTEGGTARCCEARGCAKTTRENKPYCSNHVLMHPYARNVRCLYDERKNLEGLALTGAPIDPEDVLAKDILLLMRLKGPLTMQRISREMSCEHQVIKRYIEAMENARILVESPGNRTTFYSIVA